MARLPIKLTESISDSLPLLHEGNKIAEEIIKKILRRGDVFSLILLDMDDMNIRGEQVCVAYAWCQQNLDLLYRDVKKRCPKLVRAVNYFIKDPRACTGGATLGREKYPEAYK